MAETADMLTTDDQIVILPDMRAGCSMADMADIEQTERAWKELTKLFGDTMIPLTYVNSTAAIKAFCGRNGGATVTSSNAKQMVSWRLLKKNVSSFTGSTFRRNTAYDLGIPLDKMAVWDPHTDSLEYDGDIEEIRDFMERSLFSSSKLYSEKHRECTKNHPDMNIIAHPECCYEVVAASRLCRVNEIYY